MKPSNVKMRAMLKRIIMSWKWTPRVSAVTWARGQGQGEKVAVKTAGGEVVFVWYSASKF